MAFVDGPISISFTFQDDDLAEASTSVKLPAGTTLAAAHTFAASYVNLLTPVTNCALISYDVTQQVYDDTYPVAAVGSDVENKGVLTIRTANNNTSTISWPGVLEAILINTITPSSTYIDLANVAVAALITALTNGLAGTQPSNRNGQDFRSVKEAYKQNRSSQKSRQYKG
jgi:hypothetical protein